MAREGKMPEGWTTGEDDTLPEEQDEDVGGEAGTMPQGQGEEL